MDKYNVIICCGVNRSGSTWTYQVVKAILKTKNISFTDLSFLDATDSSDISKAISSDNDLVVVKMHEYSDNLKSIKNKNNFKLIYSHRDIRDIVLSLHRKTNKTFDEITKMPYLNNSVKSYEYWRELDDFLPVSYHDIESNSKKAIDEISNHLLINLNDSQRLDISEEFSKEMQKKRIRKSKSSINGMFKLVLQKLNLDLNARDNDSLLHFNHIQSGQIDEWKTMMSYSQAQEIYEKFKDWMTHLNYKK